MTTKFHISGVPGVIEGAEKAAQTACPWCWSGLPAQIRALKPGEMLKTRLGMTIIAVRGEIRDQN